MKLTVREYAEQLSTSERFIFIVSVIIGIVLFHVLLGIPKVGIITLNTAFLTEETKVDTITMLRYAGDDPSIKAVVINLDSPGGEVTKVEEIYLEVLKLKARKPVVVSVDGIALSGGYYIASAANYIYVKPSSEVGNIGVISTLPEPWEPDNVQITTGPYKVSGKSQKNYAYQVEAIKQGFILAVSSQRGDKLHMDPQQLSSAEIFLGAEGVKSGLVDAIGTGSDAVHKAAGIAGIAHYDTIDINDATNITFAGGFHGLADVNGSRIPLNYYLYEEVR